MGTGNAGLGWAHLGQGAENWRAGEEPGGRELEIPGFYTYFKGTMCVSYQVDSLSVSVQGKTPSLPFGKGMLEKNLFLCKRNPKTFTLHGPSCRVVSSHTLALQDVSVRKYILSSPS